MYDDPNVQALDMHILDDNLVLSFKATLEQLKNNMFSVRQKSQMSSILKYGTYYCSGFPRWAVTASIASTRKKSKLHEIFSDFIG